MANAMIGWTNRVLAAALSVGSQAAGLPVSNLQGDICSPSTGWQTVAGVLTPSAGAWFQLDAGAPVTWQAFLLARTNLSSGATVRWRVGPATALVEEVPTIDLNYQAGAISAPAGYTFSRASAGWTFGPTGVLTQVASNTLRYAYDPTTLECLGALKEEARTNSVRNPRGEGSTGGGMPTNWSSSTNAAGGSITVTANGTSAGIPYTAVRFQGTPSAGNTAVISFETATGITAATAQTWVASIFNALGAGAIPAGATFTLVANENTSAGALVTSHTSAALPVPTGAALAAQRPEYAVLLTGGGTVARVQFSLTITFAAGAAFDFTLWLSPQVEQGKKASSPILPAIGTPAATTRAGDIEYITGLSIAACDGYSVFVDAVITPGVSGVAVTWGMSPATNAFADSIYQVLYYSAAGLTQLNSVTGNGPGPAAAATPGSRNRVAMAYGAGTAIAASNGASATASGAFASNGVCTTMTLGSSPWGAGGANPATGVGIYRRIAFYQRRLTDGQAVALSSTGSSMDATALTYDSGTISAGIVPKFLQSATIAPAAITGQYCRCDISDPGNPDNFVNVPGAYAGPIWQPQSNISPATTVGRDDGTDEVVTRGGQEFPTTYYQRRRLEIDFQGIRTSEIWTYVDDLDATCRLNRNCITIPNPASATLNREVVFGRIKPRADLSYFQGAPDRRAWKATITERL